MLSEYLEVHSPSFGKTFSALNGYRRKTAMRPIIYELALMPYISYIFKRTEMGGTAASNKSFNSR